MAETLYIVKIATGQCEDYYEAFQFATTSKGKAERWVERFNKIIDDNRERITDSELDSDYNSLFWHNYIVYEEPAALIEETELR